MELNGIDRYCLMPGIPMVEETHFGGRTVKVYVNRPENISELLETTTNHWPDKVALIEKDQGLNYQEFEQKVNTIAANLSTRWRVHKGDRMAILLGNTVEFCCTLFALARLGVIAVPLNHLLETTEINYLLDNAGCKYLVADHKSWLKLAPYKEHWLMVEQIFITGKDIPTDTLPYDILLTPANMNIDVHVKEDDIALILYTAGTTGKPKGVMITHLGIIHSVLNYQYYFGTEANDLTLINVPLCYATGLIGQLIHMVYVGGATVLMEQFTPREMIELMCRYRITFTFAAPQVYLLLITSSYLEMGCLPHWRLVAYYGEPMPEDAIRRLASSFPNLSLYHVYGAVETSSLATILPFQDFVRKSASIGKPLPIAQCLIVDGKGQNLGPNEVGELWIKGPHVVPGYWGNAEDNAKEFSDGFWHSGDLIKMDHEGYLYLVDRKQTRVIGATDQIFCLELENVLNRHPKIWEAAVVGVSDQNVGEEVRAFIVIKPNEAMTANEIKQFVANWLGADKVPQNFKFIESMPHSPTGKILRGLLKKPQ